MNKSQTNLTLLNTVFVTSLVMSNVIASKIIYLCGLTTPAAVAAYPVTFLMTDVIGEIWGKAEANKTVRIGFFCQLLALVFMGAAILLPSAPFWENKDAFNAILGMNFRITAASLVAYCLSQSWDVAVFHYFKNRHGDKKRWIRNNASTMTSQIIDTAIFIGIGFYGAVPNLLVMIFSQLIVKWTLALLDTPIFYLMTSKTHRPELACRFSIFGQAQKAGAKGADGDGKGNACYR